MTAGRWEIDFEKNSIGVPILRVMGHNQTLIEILGVYLEAKLRVKNLSKVFGYKQELALGLLDKSSKRQDFLKIGLTPAVLNCSFEVFTGEIFVIMGLSGCGKSTLVRMLNGLISPTQGEVLLDSQNLAALSEDQLVQLRRKNISMVFQKFALMPHLTVRENIELGLSFAGLDLEKRKTRSNQALKKVGLEQWSNQRPNQLSGGMQQRVGLARALAMEPDVLLMDEAFSALDPLTRAQMQDELLRIQKTEQRTIIFISHDIEEALKIGDRIAMIHDGSIVQVGPPDELLLKPANTYVKKFFKNVDATRLLSVLELASMDEYPVVKIESEYTHNQLLQMMDENQTAFVVIIEKEGKFLGLVSRTNLESGEEQIVGESNFIGRVIQVKEELGLSDILPLLGKNAWPLPIVDGSGVFKGVVSKSTCLAKISELSR